MIIADMHTHSEYSHDSVCKIEDMLLAQRDKGTAIFAVTDHFDGHSQFDYDIFTPIRDAFQTVEKLNKKYEGKPLLLAGVEISEGHLYPEAVRRLMDLVEYDVVIGSVHIVHFKDITGPLACVDYSKRTPGFITEFVDAYFDSALEMTEKTDFDILAHLTYPFRYINGKYHVGLDVMTFKGKIRKILSAIIEKGIALEVNTSSFDLLGEFLPSTDILKMYRDMGGYLITLGSDAHVAQNASLNFGKAIKLLKEIGFKNVYYYKSRKAYPIDV